MFVNIIIFQCLYLVWVTMIMYVCTLLLLSKLQIMNLIRILPDYQVGIGFQLYVLER